MTLIKYGAEVNHVTSRGMTPLTRSAILDKPRSATVLRLAGAKLHQETRACGTALECAAERGHLEVIRAIMMEPETARTCIHHETLEGWTALCKAARSNQVAAAQVLIEQYGAKVDFVTKFDNTALILAVQEGHEDMVRMLLEHHANPDRATRIGTAREIGLKLGNHHIIEMLVKVKGLQPVLHPTEKAIRRAEQRAELVRQ